MLCKLQEFWRFRNTWLSARLSEASERLQRGLSVTGGCSLKVMPRTCGLFFLTIK